MHALRASNDRAGPTDVVRKATMVRFCFATKASARILGGDGQNGQTRALIRLASSDRIQSNVHRRLQFEHCHAASGIS